MIILKQIRKADYELDFVVQSKSVHAHSMLSDFKDKFHEIFDQAIENFVDEMIREHKKRYERDDNKDSDS